jgi:hypothetical protein
MAHVQEVANTLSSNLSKWIFTTGASSHMSLDRNCFESLSSVRCNLVLAYKTPVKYTGISSLSYSNYLPSGDIAGVWLCRSYLFQVYRSLCTGGNRVKSIEKFTLINDGILQVGSKLDRSIVRIASLSGNDCILDLIPGESASLADDTAYSFLNATLDHPFQTNVIWKLYKMDTLSWIVLLPLPVTCALFCQNLRSQSQSHLSLN